MTISSLEDGCYMEVNDTFVEVTGYSREEAIGRTSTEIGFISADYRARLADILQSDGAVGNLELDLVGIGGRKICCLYSGEIIEVDDSPRLLSIAVDITSRKYVEEELRKSEERFVQMFENMGSGVAIYEAVDGGSDFVF